MHADEQRARSPHGYRTLSKVQQNAIDAEAMKHVRRDIAMAKKALRGHKKGSMVKALHGQKKCALFLAKVDNATENARYLLSEKLHDAAMKTIDKAIRQGRDAGCRL
jgi:hypothetical protein